MESCLLLLVFFYYFLFGFDPESLLPHFCCLFILSAACSFLFLKSVSSSLRFLLLLFVVFCNLFCFWIIKKLVLSAFKVAMKKLSFFLLFLFFSLYFYCILENLLLSLVLTFSLALFLYLPTVA